MSKTTLDLSTLSDISDGTHTVKVKAKADGYRDSEFSNEVSYTKTSAPPVYTVTFSSDFTVTGKYLYGIKYVNEAGVLTSLPVTEDNYTTYRGQTFKASSIDILDGNFDYAKITIDGVAYYHSRSWGTPSLPLTLSAPATITKIYCDY